MDTHVCTRHAVPIPLPICESATEGPLNRVRCGTVVLIDHPTAQSLQPNQFPLLQWVALVQPDQIEQLNDWMHLPLAGVITAPDYSAWDQIEPKLRLRQAVLRQWYQANQSTLALLGKLTQREFEVLKASLTYEVASELAQRIGASPRTVEAHRYNMARRLVDGSFRDLVGQFRVLSQGAGHLGLPVEAVMDSERARIKTLQNERELTA